jgi:D-sedoheptulose 7-phosphate isomerase
MDETLAFVDRYLRETAEVAARSPREDLGRAIGVLFEAWRRGGTVFTCGNGGSAANASHLACDLTKFTRAASRPPLRAIGLGDNPALVSAITNDLGFSRLFVEQLEGVFRAGDVLVALSVHGGRGEDQAGPWSQNLPAAARFARAAGGSVVAFVGYDGGALAELADVAVIVPRCASGATSTPHVEGMHEVYHHLVCERLRQLIAAEPAGAT